MSDLLKQLREAAAEVADRARWVRINEAAIPAYAASLPQTEAPDADETPPGSREDRAAFWFTLDAINFGSGWFPTLNKRPGHSGYRTIAAGVRERFETQGPWSPEELQHLTPENLASTLSQDPNHELMALFAASLNDLGRHIADAGSFEAVVGDKATALVNRLATWDCFADTSDYEELSVPFLKRAQITADDLHRTGVAHFDDLGRLTMFADNLVPHVLRLDGILRFDPQLVGRIDREELIEHGSPEEVEIRACALHAVERVVAERPGTTAAETDQFLWLRGGEPRYKAQPRHRARTTAY
ncbi:MAG TPA: queuosine salvage family protein [Solirubrobacteraceae bacterium]|nr:queuosine salvage family protein [Solirubrobacteraceae bacterium]